MKLVPWYYWRTRRNFLGRVKKWSQIHTGPYHIYEVAEKNTYILCCLKGIKKGNILKTLVNVTSLKLYHERTPPDQVLHKYNKISIVIDFFPTEC